jgi:hypothetical protein
MKKIFQNELKKMGTELDLKFDWLQRDQINSEENL